MSRLPSLSRAKGKKSFRRSISPHHHHRRGHHDDDEQFSVDMRAPQNWYPEALTMKRKLILHVGPTNSGKTYAAIKRLASAKSALYCGPLRLLAAEIYDKLNLQLQVPCSLLTGQQEIVVENAQHTSCTIEMANLSVPVEVAVIDEYQLISDEQRGWAWSRALLGLQAEEIHLTGDLSRIELIREIAARMGDDLEVIRYDRLLPLEPERGLKGSASLIKKGDAVISFSRGSCYELKRMIEMTTDHKCCVVYGNLPPESRKQQADLFNDTSSEYTVLVGTDAIGMGLNLNIGRIVFSTVQKFDGQRSRKLVASEVRQIAGRAGRFASKYQKGKVTCLHDKDMAHIEKMLKVHPEYGKEDKRAVIFPSFDQFVDLKAALGPKSSFITLISYFTNFSELDPIFKMADATEMMKKAKLLDPIGLELEPLYTFCMAPADLRDGIVPGNLYDYAQQWQEIGQVNLRLSQTAHFSARTTSEQIKILESQYKVCELYLWLSLRFEGFVDAEHAETALKSISDFVSEKLSWTSHRPFKFRQPYRSPKKKVIKRGSHKFITE